MQDSNSPAKLPAIWAHGASSPFINAIPTASQQSIKNGAASYQDGFPPNCFIPYASGGAGPFGGDTNGILQPITAGLQWLQAGGPLFYDSVFSAEIGGYPKGTRLIQVADSTLEWISTVDNNTSDPDTGGANWTSLQARNNNWNGTNIFNAASIFNGKHSQTFSASGTFTVPTGVTTVYVEIWGGGPGSGGCQGATLNCGSTGGGAGYAQKLITGLTPGATIAATIGAAGTGGVTGVAQPTSGGTSSFGAFVSATGGSGGINGTGSTPGSPGGTPGVGVGGDLNLTGGPGGTNWLSGSIAIVAAAAGTAPLMPPAQPNEGDIPGVNAPNYGGAGGAASTNTGLSLAGGNGSPGLIIVRW